MQSDNACACFVRVGRCCLGSIVGSILEYFLEPRGATILFVVRLFPKEMPLRNLGSTNAESRILSGGLGFRPGGVCGALKQDPRSNIQATGKGQRQRQRQEARSNKAEIIKRPTCLKARWRIYISLSLSLYIYIYVGSRVWGLFGKQQPPGVSGAGVGGQLACKDKFAMSWECQTEPSRVSEETQYSSKTFHNGGSATVSQKVTENCSKE